MKPKTMILMVVAVVCGLGASYMTSRLLADREDQQPTTKIIEKEIPKIPVLLAKKHLELQTFIKNPKDLFVEHQVAKDDTWKDALSDWKALEGKTLRRQIGKGRHVTAEDLGDSAPVLELPPGHRAMGLSVNLKSSVSGFASLPGSRVDIIWSRKADTDEKSFAKILLQNVLVLAADTQSVRNPDGTAMPASVVTLALNPEDVRRVINAEGAGSMTLVLRVPGDTNVVEDTMTTLAETMNGRKDRPKDEIVDVLPQPFPEVTRVPTVPGQTAQPAQPGTAQPAPTFEPLPVVEFKQRKTFVVWHRQGPRQWKEVFFLDDDNNNVADGVQRVPDPQVGAQPQQNP